MATTTETRPADRRPILRSTARENHFAGVGGIDIFYRVWRPDEPPHAVLVIAPGFNSHSGHYEWVGQQFASKNVAVYAIDHRGRGRSDGKRFFVKDVLEYVEDLSTLVNIARAKNPGRRVYLLGHSAGGVISCIYALEHPDDIDGLICESFAFKLPAPDIALTIVKGLSHIAPNARVLKLENKLFSRDPAVVEAMNADLLINNERQPSLTVAAMVRADERLQREFPQITLPLLILHGMDDRVTLPIGSQRFYDEAGSTDKTLKLYDGYFHDLLNDVDKELVLGDIDAWIAARTLS